MSMSDTLVSFQVAKLAKEKGFDWKVRYSYGHKINPHIAYPKEDYAVPSDFNSPNIGQNWSHLYSAPTQSLLQRWLREVHGIEVYVIPYSITNNHKMIGGKGFYEVIVDKISTTWSDFKTYEESLEEGLKQGLKLI